MASMEEENELIALRRKKLDALHAKGVEPFGAGFDVSGSIAEVREQFREGETLRAAGRITAHRDMGKSDFLEVETPILQTIAGGAAAEPFSTHHKTLGLDLYLRIAPELYLKRLLVGGFNKVFEINRNFRNEGISRKHNPEFTMLEAYWAYADFEKMADLVEELICHLAEKISDSLQIEHRDVDGKITRTINLKRPWRRARYHDLMREVAGADWFDLTSAKRRERATDN